MKTHIQQTSDPSSVHSHNLEKLVKLSRRLLAESDVDKVLALAMDHLIELTGAERGIIILFDLKGNELFQTARNLNKKDIEHPKFEISHSIINQVKKTGKPKCFRNAHESKLLTKSKSIARFKILSVICLPLLIKGKMAGVIYLDNRTVEGIFEPAICDFAVEFADFISLAAFNALTLKQMHNTVDAFERDLRERYDFDGIICHHSHMVKILRIVSKVANSDATVLILGESGTGKELIARSLHYNSFRKDKPFVAINCGALAENLIESELFGHVKGAFTSAFKDEIGWFGRAHGGTIFLDEVSDMSPALQAKLLRVLQTNEYSPVGSSHTYYSNVRILAATNTNLKKLVEQKKFRKDLFYRLNVIDITLPPLRERKSDIPLLVDHFLGIYGKKNSKKDLQFSQKALGILMQYDFPGNVRELENIIERVTALAESNIIDSDLLPIKHSQQPHQSVYSAQNETLTEIKRKAAWKAEQEFLTECLRVSFGHITNAAKIAGIDVSDFHKAMKKHNIVASDYK